MADFLHVVCPHCDTVNRVPELRLDDRPTCGQCKKELFMGQPLELSGKSFPQHISRNDIPVLVDFWAPWCGPCQGMAPGYARAAAQLEPRMRVAKLNTEDARELAAGYAIRSIPTLALFRRGREVARQAGAMDAAGILAWARAHAEASA